MISIKIVRMCIEVGDKLKEQEITAIVCHCNLLPMDSSMPSLKACTSSGKKRSCTKLWATRPPSPLSHIHTLAVAGRGLLMSWNVGC